MNYKKTLSTTLLLAVSALNPLYAGSSDSSSIGISLTLPFICKADVLSVEKQADSDELNIQIYELCNGGKGYTLELMFAGQESLEISHRAKDINLTIDGNRVLSQRKGAYHKKNLYIVKNAKPELEITGAKVTPL